MTVQDILRHCRMFELLDDGEIDRIGELVEEHHFHRGDYVCREGAWGDSMYIIGSGEVKITKKLDVEHTWDITSLRHGDFFGEVALIDGSPRTATAVALTATTVLEIYGREFKVLLSRGDALSQKMLESLLRTLINRMRATDELVTHIMAEKLKGETGQAASMREIMMRAMISKK
jgi:CRP/FNR family transcriptional regulator, cyclic AMP receptor protein